MFINSHQIQINLYAKWHYSKILDHVGEPSSPPPLTPPKETFEIYRSPP